MFVLGLPDSASDASGCAWSAPIPVTYPGTPELFVPIPVTQDWVARHVATGGAGKPVLSSQVEVATGGAPVSQRTVAVTRLSMTVHSPGCMHVVLHTAGCNPPFLLENRTAETFFFRQEGTQDAWRRLDPLSALGFSWPFPTSAPPASFLF